MSINLLSVDAYQIATLFAYYDAHRVFNLPVSMNFFFRKMPQNRNFVVSAALSRVLAHATKLHELPFFELLDHPVFGPLLRDRPRLQDQLRNYQGFKGDIWAVPDGTPVFAAPGYRKDGNPLMVKGRHITVYEPMVSVHTDLVTSKLIETPWLSYINHMSMVASKAARVVRAAGGKPVYEFGQRRTHPEAAVDASYAAFIGGCTATSNMAAWFKYGIPTVGTMDHFYVMNAEEDGLSKQESECKAFLEFFDVYRDNSIFLVDTYNIAQGIRNAVKASHKRLKGIRIDSNVNRETLTQARAMLILLEAPHAQIIASDGLDERKIEQIQDLADGFGVGENIVCSPDSAVGVGAVGKLTENEHGRAVMKISEGSGKMTLPGNIQVYRNEDYDILALAEEERVEGERLLHRVWGSDGCKFHFNNTPEWGQARLKSWLSDMPAMPLHAVHERKILVTDALAELIIRTAD